MALKKAFHPWMEYRYAKELKGKADFWYRVWIEAGSPTPDTLVQIKKKA